MHSLQQNDVNVCSDGSRIKGHAENTSTRLADCTYWPDSRRFYMYIISALCEQCSTERFSGGRCSCQYVIARPGVQQQITWRDINEGK